MPIKKKTTTAPKSASKSKSNTPHIQPSVVGIKAKSLVGLHDNIEKLKKAKSAMEDDPTRGELLSKARELAIKERMGSFYVDLPDNKSLLVKPSTRRYPLSDVAAERVEEIIDDAGYESSDYYQESQEIKMDANAIYDRLGDDDWGTFQGDLAEFMSERGLGDCWEIVSKITAKPDFYDSRHGLPNEVNLEIEKVAPTSVSITAKRSI